MEYEILPHPLRNYSEYLILLGGRSSIQVMPQIASDGLHVSPFETAQEQPRTEKKPAQQARVLACICHEDDELWITALLLAASDPTVCCRTWYLTGRGTHREKESRRALHIIDPSGALLSGTTFFSFPDTGLSNYVPDVADKLSAELNRFQPTVVVTHDGPSDDHRDHQAAYEAVSIAIRYRAVAMLTFATPSTRMNDFDANLFVPLDFDAMQRKIASVHAYLSQINKPFISTTYLTKFAESVKYQHPSLISSSAGFFEPYRLSRAQCTPALATFLDALFRCAHSCPSGETR